MAMTETTKERKARERQDLKRKKRKLYKKWRKYLSDSRLSSEEIGKRAKSFTNRGEKVPND